MAADALFSREYSYSKRLLKICESLNNFKGQGQGANQVCSQRGHFHMIANGVKRSDLSPCGLEDLAEGCPGEGVVEKACAVSLRLFP
jgi:hypothetical protein